MKKSIKKSIKTLGMGAILNVDNTPRKETYFSKKMNKYVKVKLFKAIILEEGNTYVQDKNGQNVKDPSKKMIKIGRKRLKAIFKKKDTSKYKFRLSFTYKIIFINSEEEVYGLDSILYITSFREYKKGDIIEFYVTPNKAYSEKASRKQEKRTGRPMKKFFLNTWGKLGEHKSVVSVDIINF